jgi:hypothetical protein
VDFAEILSLHWAGTAAWFDFLNLGYKLAPSAGTDFPWGDVPGTVRNYVKLDGPFTPQAWFDGLKAGHTFVTSGPMLELSVNGQSMGSEIHLKKGESLTISATASLNPDIDALESLELIEQGTTVKTVSAKSGAPEIQLHHVVPATHGTWYVLRARGKHATVHALSGPVYVIVDGHSFWKAAAVPSIVGQMKRRMREVLGPRPPDETEEWETQEADAKYWDAEQEALTERIARADALYADLLKRAAH